MTTSTVPITLPARHRQAAPTWRFHVVVAWLTYWVALAVWTLRDIDREHGRRHTVVIAAAAVLVVAALLALLLTR